MDVNGVYKPSNIAGEAPISGDKYFVFHTMEIGGLAVDIDGGIMWGHRQQ
jgi:hypothetical protein